MFAYLKQLGNRDRHYSSHNYHFGPFTFSQSDRKGGYVRLVLNSRESENDGCHFLISTGRYSIIVELPDWVLSENNRVEAEWVDTRRRSIGISFGEGTVHISWFSTRKVFEWPWCQMYQVSQHFIDYDGNISKEEEYTYWSAKDYDGTKIFLRTYVKRTVYAVGKKKGFWRVLNVFKKVSYRLCIDFSDYVGKEKDSWKGGVKQINTSLKEIDRYHRPSMLSKSVDSLIFQCAVNSTLKAKLKEEGITNLRKEVNVPTVNFED